MKKITLPKQYDREGNLISHKVYGNCSYKYEHKGYVLLPCSNVCGSRGWYQIITPEGEKLNESFGYSNTEITLDNERYVLNNLKKCKEFINAHIQNGENYENN